MKTLYVTDLDGTLLNTDSRISDYSLQVINELVEQGMVFTYATARSLVSAAGVTQGLSTKIPIVAYNGAFIIQPSTEEIIFETAFTKEQIQEVETCVKKHHIFPIVYSYVNQKESLSWVTAEENDGIRRYLSLRKNDKRLRPLENDEKLYEGKAFGFTCIGEREELLPVYNTFREKEEFNCTLQQELYRPEYWCEIYPKQATKANAVEKLKKLWNCDRVVCFGDAINDIPMFQTADECYAVENAVPELKAIATDIIASNNDDGVAKWIAQDVLKNR